MLSFKKINEDSRPIAYVTMGEKKGDIVYLTAENIDKVPNEQMEKTKDIQDVIDFTTLQKQLKKIYGKTIRLNALDYKILNKCVKEDLEPDDPRLQKICGLIRDTMKKDATKSIQVMDGFLMFLPPKNKSFRAYVAGPAGSGKSVMCGKIIEEFKRLRPKERVYIFSDVDEDKALDEKLGENDLRVILNNEIVTNPITIDDIETGSLCLFDDVDAIPEKKIKNAINILQNEILRRGRHPPGYNEEKYEISCINTAHNMTSYLETKIILNESNIICVFPRSTSKHNLSYVLTKYYGLTQEEVNKVIALPTRWAIISRDYPAYCIWQSGCFIFDR